MSPTKEFPVLTHVIDYENGDIEYEKFLELFQYLVDTGLAWQFQGSYGRTAISLIDEGLISKPNA
jgi:hypothetical protein